ncbi:MAG TPA: DUF1015 domain-containing protein, partial [Acidimicrobiales bacterium]|nr:DUF1015 domain-containing protein [Acidimicrobiales bacterium]
MPVLLPFRGLRPDPAVVGPLSDVVCPPYDVINQAQRLALLERSPYNVVRIELPDGDYDEAADLLERWRVDGALARDQAAALYGYRMTPDRGPAEPTRDATWQTVGVIGALVLGPPGTGILPHEQTTPKAKSDRLELIRATNANTSPIWCLCTAPGLSEAVNLAISEAAAAASAGRAAASRAVDDDGCVHELWPITDPAVHEAVAKAVGGGPLLVADGHHRYETALAYLAERTAAGHLGRASAIDASGGPAALMALVVELAVDQLHVQAIHRLVCTAGADVVEAFKPDYDVTPTSSRGEALLREMSRMGAV